MKSFGFQQTSNGEKKRYPFQEIQNMKNVVIAELRAAVMDKCKISLKIWLRIKNIESESLTNYSTGYGMRNAQNLVIGDSDFIYVLTEKIYILHHIEGMS